MPTPEPPQLRVASTSACADASLQAKIARLREHSVEQRILAALSMKSKFSWLPPAQVAAQAYKRRAS